MYIKILHPYVRPLLHPSVNPYIHLSAHPYVLPLFNSSVNPSTHTSIYPSIRMSDHSSIGPPTHSSIYPPIHPFRGKLLDAWQYLSGVFNSRGVLAYYDDGQSVSGQKSRYNSLTPPPHNSHYISSKWKSSYVSHARVKKYDYSDTCIPLSSVGLF